MQGKNLNNISARQVGQRPPKAEVTGSNPVGRANNFNGLTDKSFARLFV
jgi:hypothetical protein